MVPKKEVIAEEKIWDGQELALVSRPRVGLRHHNSIIRDFIQAFAMMYMPMKSDCESAQHNHNRHRAIYQNV